MLLFQCARCQRKLWKYLPFSDHEMRDLFKEQITHAYQMASADAEITCACGNEVGHDVGENILLLPGTYVYDETSTTKFMNQALSFYRKIPRRLATVLIVIGASIGLFFFVILGNMAKDGSIRAAILFGAVALFIVGRGPLNRWQIKRRARKVLQQRQARVDNMLAGRTPATVLAEAPFSYSRWPDGDNNYLINDDRAGEIIHQAHSPESSELWILERTLADERGIVAPNGRFSPNPSN